MATIDDLTAKSGSGSSRAPRIAVWSAVVVISTFVTLLAGVGMAALLGQRGNEAFWIRLANVGQTFGVLSSIISGLALGALVVTARLQFREIQGNRRELERQREFLMQSHSELRRTAEANRGQLHLEILRLAIDDPQLAEVWPPYLPGLSPKQNRQYLYANIIYQFQQTWMRVGGHGDEDVLGTMRYLFTSPIIRDYWKAAARARASLIPGSEEYLLAQSLIVGRTMARGLAMRTGRHAAHHQADSCIDDIEDPVGPMPFTDPSSCWACLSGPLARSPG